MPPQKLLHQRHDSLAGVFQHEMTRVGEAMNLRSREAPLPLGQEAVVEQQADQLDRPVLLGPGRGQVVRRDGAALVELRVKLACLNVAGRPARLPAALRAAFDARLPTQECA